MGRINFNGNLDSRINFPTVEEFDAQWPIGVCNLCGFVLNTENAETILNCPSCSSRPRLRTLPILLHILEDLISENSDGEILAFSRTSDEAACIDHRFTAVKSVSLFGNYGDGHSEGVDVRNLSRFSDQQFSATYSMLLFDYFPEHVTALRELSRVTREGGIFLTHIGNHRLLDGYCPAYTHSRVVAKPNHFEYLKDDSIPSIKVGRDWFLTQMNKCGFSPNHIMICDPISNEFHTWYIGLKRVLDDTVDFFINPRFKEEVVEENDLIAFLHGQRTAGSNFRRQVLAQAFSENQVYASQYRDSWKQWKDLDFEELGGFRAFVGHCDYGNKEMFRKVHFITLLRHPVYRFFSLYYYSKKREDSRYNELAVKYDLKDFFQQLITSSTSGYNYFNNALCRRISGQPNFEATLKCIEERYLAIGCTERMSSFAKWVAGLLGDEELEMESVESDREKYAHLLDNQDIIDMILRHNQEDEKLFKYMNENYFHLPNENYPQSSDTRGITEGSNNDDSNFLIKWNNDIETDEYRIIIRDSKSREITEKIKATGNSFLFDWSKYDASSEFSYVVQYLTNSGWEKIHDEYPLVPSPQYALSRFDPKREMMITMLRWEPVAGVDIYRIIIRNDVEIISKVPTTNTTSLFDWSDKDLNARYRYKVQYALEGKWVEATPYYVIDLPINEAMNRMKDETPDRFENLHSIEKNIISRGVSKTIKLEISAPTLPKGVNFTEHGFNRETRCSDDVVIGAKGQFIFVSNDYGFTWEAIFIEGIAKVKNTYRTQKGSILVTGPDDSNNGLNRIVRVRDGKLIESNLVGLNCWHGTFSIDEHDGVIMFSEYPTNRKTQENHVPASVFKSTDDGRSWQSVFTMDFPEIRHFHTCTALQNGEWLVTSGDSPNQCRFWKSSDTGDNWIEITNPNPTVNAYNNHKQSIYRTVVMHLDEKGFIWATDDPIGPLNEYHNPVGEMVTRSRLVRLDTDQQIDPQVLCEIGMHIRSMIDVGDAFLLISEAKRLDIVPTPQVFLVFKNELDHCHHLMDIPNPENRINAATLSKSSIKSKDGIFFTLLPRGTFSKTHCGMIRWKLTTSDTQAMNTSQTSDVVET
jgi:hypothetical protein